MFCYTIKQQDITFVGGQPEVEENLNDVTVGIFSVVDPDKTDTHMYTLTNNADGKFVLSTNGQLSVSAGTKILQPFGCSRN